MAKRDNVRAAQALAAWSLHNYSTITAEEVAKTHGVSVPSLWRYLRALKTDSELSQNFNEAAKELLNRHWADDIDDTMSTLQTRMKALAVTSESLQDITHAYRNVAEIALAKEILKE